MNYPRCHKSVYKHYNYYKYNSKIFNLIIIKHHTVNIDTAYSKLVNPYLSMKGI